MDKKVFSMALLTIFSAFILIIVIIYATNVDKINSLFGRGGSGDSAESASSQEVSVTETEYGQQIGDDLKSFMYDENFFDETEQVPAVVVIQQKQTQVDSSQESSSGDVEDSRGSAGQAVVGELENPDALPDMPGFGLSGDISMQGNIPGDQTIGGTPVGNIP